MSCASSVSRDTSTTLDAYVGFHAGPAICDRHHHNHHHPAVYVTQPMPVLIIQLGGLEAMPVKFLAQGNNSNSKRGTVGIEPVTIKYIL